MKSSIVLFISALFLIGCDSGSNDEEPFFYQLTIPNIGTVKYTLLNENGGRASWYKGTIAAHNKIAYDTKTREWGADL